MKYEPLKRHLQSQLTAAQARMTFAEIEGLLAFPLPMSARKYQAWWSNTRQGHSHAAAWLDADWRTADLDLAGEAVTFVKEQPLGVAEEGSAFRHRDAASALLQLDGLSHMALKLIEDHASEHGVSPARAAAEILNDTATQRLKAMFDWFQQATPYLATDSVDLIREGRDER